jgi:hypothetical protein
MMATSKELKEAETILGKSNLCEDKVHVLQAILKRLKDERKWPDIEKKQELGAVFPGLFYCCVSAEEVKEYQVVRYLDPVKERRRVRVISFYL